MNMVFEMEFRVEFFLASEGEHGVVLTQVMHLSGRVARPYNICVGANSMFALPFARTSNGTNLK
jgi:hypothetical protein